MYSIGTSWRIGIAAVILVVAGCSVVGTEGISTAALTATVRIVQTLGTSQAIATAQFSLGSGFNPTIVDLTQGERVSINGITLLRERVPFIGLIVFRAEIPRIDPGDGEFEFLFVDSQEARVEVRAAPISTVEIVSPSLGSDHPLGTPLIIEWTASDTSDPSEVIYVTLSAESEPSSAGEGENLDEHGHASTSFILGGDRTSFTFGDFIGLVPGPASVMVERSRVQQFTEGFGGGNITVAQQHTANFVFGEATK